MNAGFGVTGWSLRTALAVVASPGAVSRRTTQADVVAVCHWPSRDMPQGAVSLGIEAQEVKATLLPQYGN
jgi:hypothetical protein